MNYRRPKSAPPENFVTRNIGRKISDTTRYEYNSEHSKGDVNTLKDRMNKFHTTERMLHRMKERRRTEAEIVVNETPSGLLAMEHPTRKVTPLELENVVARVCRPTASYSARISSNRRINARDIYVPPKVVRWEYYSIEHGRFKGNRSLDEKAMKALVNRLSNYDSERRPPESKRCKTPDERKRLGPVASYRWLGIKNC